MAQLQKFQALVAGTTNGTHTTKVGACLMVCTITACTCTVLCAKRVENGLLHTLGIIAQNM